MTKERALENGSLNDFIEAIGLRKIRVDNGMTIPGDKEYAKAAGEIHVAYIKAKFLGERALTGEERGKG